MSSSSAGRGGGRGISSSSWSSIEYGLLLLITSSVGYTPGGVATGSDSSQSTIKKIKNKVALS